MTAGCRFLRGRIGGCLGPKLSHQGVRTAARAPSSRRGPDIVIPARPGPPVEDSYSLATGCLQHGLSALVSFLLNGVWERMSRHQPGDGHVGRANRSEGAGPEGRCEGPVRRGGPYGPATRRRVPPAFAACVRSLSCWPAGPGVRCAGHPMSLAVGSRRDDSQQESATEKGMTGVHDGLFPG
jgi:hypothetical protein